MHQFPFFLGYIIHSIFFFATWSTGSTYLAVDILGLVLNCFSILLLALYGEVNFNRMNMFGHYQVGYKEFKSKQLGNMVSVYYPISKETHSRMIGRHNVSWLRDGDKTLLGLAKASGEYGSDKHASV